MARIRLRPWQHAALAQFGATTAEDFLAVGTPGSGKTTFALAAVRTLLATRSAPVVIVAPTAHLKVQWAHAAAAFQLHLDPGWSPADEVIPRDMHGIVTTYQQVASNPGSLRRFSNGAYVVLDEAHHAGDEQAWGQALAEAFGGAARRLLLSGTPFRSDTRAIPFVRYSDEEAQPDFVYGYGDALKDGGVVRPIYFPRLGGEMEWSAPDGRIHSASFDDPLTFALANQRLRTALSLEGEWMPSVLRDAVDRLKNVRRHHPAAGGLVIAMDQEHARGIASELAWRFAVHAELVTSDDPSASSRISRFAEGSGDWLVAVRMVSEGVDIPRLRVGVYATATTTELFFRQAVGRFVRWTRGVPDQRAWLYIPDDARLRAHANNIGEQRRHSLRRALQEEGEQPVQAIAKTSEVWSVEQMSLFAPLSAVATEQVVSASPWHEALPESWSADQAPFLEIELEPLPTVGTSAGDGQEGGGLTRREEKDALRASNAEVARDLVRKSGLTHAQVNAEMNKLVGLRRVNDATIAQLRERLRLAERWLARL